MTVRSKKSKAFGLLAAAAFIAGAPMAAQADDHTFTDVDDDAYYAVPVNALSAEGIIGGYPDETFRPNISLTREQAAAFLSRALGYAGGSLEALEQYDDVDSSNSYSGAIAALTDAGIFSGYNGQFNPKEEITREQMASVLVRAYDLEAQTRIDADVNLDNVHEAHASDVKKLADLKITNELADFMPKNDVSRAQFVTFLHRTWGLGDAYLSVLHTNDLHGRTDAYPQIISAVDELRAENPDALLLEAGDIFSGTLYFNEFRGQASAAFMELLEYDAFVPGNHEFDLGDDDGYHEDLAAFFEAGGFPVVASNLDFSDDPNFDGMQDKSITSDAENGMIYDGIVKEIDGEEVGIFGVDTEDTITISSTGVVEFEPAIETAARMVEEFEEAGVDKIIALTHIGYDTSSDAGNDIELAQTVDGIDLIVGGHSHTQVAPPDVITEDAEGNEKDPTVIVQAGEYGQLVGEVHLSFDEDGVVNPYSVTGQLNAVEDYEADAAAAELLLPFTEDIEELQNEETGVIAAEEFPSPRVDDPGNDANISVRNSETGLGNLIADAYLAEARNSYEDTTIAFQNSGGIRAPLDEGPVTVGDLIQIQPFGNRLAVMELTGAEVLEALEHAVSNAPEESGGFLQVAGMQFTYDSSQEEGSRVQSAEVMMDGDYVDLDENSTYRVATNNFTAAGGDGFDVFAAADADGRVDIVGKTDWEILRDYALTLGESISPQIEGRIVDTASDDN
ncbi:5'-nucleotidase C-terminal domain-containing protein [Alkalicoccus urumqiensis]|uniref:Bifunctional metallophosphatase/5'-nucleotidase n=1 Tax=Alkalicoccus urumqiensis TaxID=1548213 RepID=A0A2P6ML31_ALKUR|nr:5'-nucleotidase C-terminal domain-containing protein [Alkalicoccus urumqiensis]PRO66991.1 bifunctional metallophosphatase/5'-nucleotidase [Alkalicoccus urumqiensis]